MPQGQTAQPRQAPARPPAARPAPPAPPSRGLLDLEATELDHPDFGDQEFPVRAFETGSLRVSDVEDWDPADESGDEQGGGSRKGMRQRPSAGQAPGPDRTDRGGRGAEKW